MKVFGSLAEKESIAFYWIAIRGWAVPAWNRDYPGARIFFMGEQNSSTLSRWLSYTNWNGAQEQICTCIFRHILSKRRMYFPGEASAQSVVCPAQLRPFRFNWCCPSPANACPPCPLRTVQKSLPSTSGRISSLQDVQSASYWDRL